MKTKRYLPFAFLLATLSLSAQNKVGFAYDEAGNRVKRELVIQHNANAPKKSPSTKPSYYDVLGDRISKIMPNELGVVKVSVQDIKATDKGHIEVYTLKGTEVHNQPLTDAETMVDISDKRSGVYILKVTVNGVATTWKVTKK